MSDFPPFSFRLSAALRPFSIRRPFALADFSPSIISVCDFAVLTCWIHFACNLSILPLSLFELPPLLLGSALAVPTRPLGDLWLCYGWRSHWGRQGQVKLISRVVRATV
jgi:hypothetical protein